MGKCTYCIDMHLVTCRVFMEKKIVKPLSFNKLLKVLKKFVALL